MAREKPMSTAWEDAGCHDCPAGAVTGISGNTDNDGDPMHPKDVTITCFEGPPSQVCIGKDKENNPIIVSVRPTMKGNDRCFQHPGLIEKMDPEEYGDLDEGPGHECEACGNFIPDEEDEEDEDEDDD